MHRMRRLFVLLGVLAALIVATLVARNAEQRQEQIAESGKTVFQLDVDAVTSLAWTYGDTSLAFHKDGDTWVYDADADFPVDAEKLRSRLEVFEDFGAAFEITDVEDFDQYGLGDPVCTITICAGDEQHTIKLGNFSEIDEKRYVTFGGDTVVLAASDPFESYEAEQSDFIADDEIPDLTYARTIEFEGEVSYTATYEADGGRSLRAEDVWFAGDEPLDTTRVTSYLDTVSNLVLGEYVTYKATDEELAEYGLDDPEVTTTFTYATEKDGEADQTFVLSISRNPTELADALATEDESDDDEVSSYVRVGDSPIVYVLSHATYQTLRQVSLDDLRHHEILPASFDDVTEIDVTLDDERYTLKATGTGTERTWSYGDEDDVEISGVQNALDALTATEFTDEDPDGKLEIALTVHVDDEANSTVDIELYRHDGQSCLAVVGGKPVALVSRTSVVNLIEAINAIVL